MDCKTCKDHKRDVQPVPYIVHEAAMARQERHVKRLIIGIVIAIILGFASNMAWLFFFNQYEYVDETSTTTTTYTQDGKGLNIIGSNNEVSDESETDSDHYNGSPVNAEKERQKQGDTQTQKEKP